MAIKNLYVNQIYKGWAASQYFGVEGTYNSSTAIDPDLPIVSTDIRTSGFPIPVGSAVFSSSNITSAVIREITHPKDNLLWTVQTNGKVVTYKKDLTGETLIGTVAGSNATWAEYYNNYIYIFGTGSSKDDVSRVGPLNTLPYDGQSGNFTAGLTVTGGTSGATAIIVSDVDGGATGTLTLSNINGHFVDNETITDTGSGSATVNRTDASLITDNVWKGATLGSLTALTNTKYPTFRSVDMPNHVGHVHGDGALYFCDFINGQGLIHKISTTKVTNEGDTNGTTVPSAYNALDLPLGFYPTAIESYDTDLFITGIYQTDTTTNQGRSAWIIWDTTSDSFSTGPIFFADPIASAVLNVNGTLYIWTGNAQDGVRISVYQGGVSVREIVFQEEGLPPFAGAVDALGNRIVWGGYQTYPSTGAVVWAYGSKSSNLPTGLHNVMKTSSSGANPFVTAVKYMQQNSNRTPKLVPAWRNDSTQGIDQYSTTATLSSKIRYLFNVGVKCDIVKVSIPLAGAVAANTTITPTLYFDDFASNKVLTVINNTNNPGEKKVIYNATELKDCYCYNNFVLEIAYSGTNPLPHALPIIIGIDIKQDEGKAI
jgi:hypothetical protein